MKTCAKCGVLKSLAEFHSLKSRKDGRRSYCKACVKIYSAARYKVDPNRRKAVNAAWRANHPERMDAARVAWATDNKERMRSVKAAWYKALVASGKDPSAWRKANPEKYKVVKRKWRKANMGKVNGHTAFRHARKMKATPLWANTFFIQEAYDLAQRRTKSFNFAWHVDHVVPLRSPLVCGLHVPANLQVIPAIENLNKRNAHWPDMP